MKPFSLSTNIENGFPDGMQYIVTPNARTAVSAMVNDYHVGIHSFTIIGSYGTGKSSFLLALEEDLRTTTRLKHLLNPKTLSDAKDYAPVYKHKIAGLQEAYEEKESLYNAYKAQFDEKAAGLEPEKAQKKFKHLNYKITTLKSELDEINKNIQTLNE